MSTNKTQNYNLHSWLPQDEFHLTEINENFAALDAALHQEVSALAAALDKGLRMTTGSYTGVSTGSAVAQIDLGLKPTAVLVMATTSKVSGTLLAYLAVEGGYASPSVTLTDTGFTARNGGAYTNYNNTVYHYAAFY